MLPHAIILFPKMVTAALSEPCGISALIVTVIICCYCTVTTSNHRFALIFTRYCYSTTHRTGIAHQQGFHSSGTDQDQGTDENGTG